MRVLVTGANGFIGSNLCRHLLVSGYDVAALVRPTSDRRFLAALNGLHIHEGDLADRKSLESAMDGAEIVCHLAGHVSDWGPWTAFRGGNVIGVANVMEAARAAGARRVVHLSSLSVYGFPGGSDIAEDTSFTPRPRDRYVTTKAEGERLALSYNDRGVAVAAIRPGTVYGPHDCTTTVPLAGAIEAGRFAFIDGGRHLMAPCHVDNLAKMMRLAAESPEAPGEAFNAMDDGRTAWRQFIGWICEELECAVPRLSFPAALAWPLAVAMEAGGRVLRRRESPPLNIYRIRAISRDSHASTAKAKRLLGWQPTVSTRAGVAEAVAWYRSAKAEARA